ncbi:MULTISPECIES: hypothetical protein [Marinomonas]|uniref:Uncharacterized protein n=2 Tax=Marinomonas TaxID=28253 RepID=A0ABT3KKW2_9GAMM|nr:hypothetical protein [Marinomonas sp. KJ51-3]MCW4631193.1 hypothetical protein [Marinomonas sp. KJ51-3]
MLISSLLGSLSGIALFLSIKLLPETFSVVWPVAVLYFILSVAHQGVRIGRKTYLVNLGEGNKRTSYVSVSNTIIGIVLLVMSGISLLTYMISLEGLILIFSMIALIGCFIVIRLPEI